MEQKTIIKADQGRQELFIIREFDLSVESLFKAYVESELVAQWMGTKVLKLECKKHGSYRFETTDTEGKVLLKSAGVIHDIIENQLIIRTFEMENTPYPVQLEYLNFERTSEHTSKLQMQVIYKSNADRDEILKLPFAYGINRAHNKLQQLFKN